MALSLQTSNNNRAGISIALLITLFFPVICFAQHAGKPLPHTKTLNIIKDGGKTSSFNSGTTPVITPHDGLIFELDNNGKLPLTVDDVATVTGAAETSISPSTFDCSTTGDQVVTVTAKGASGDPTAAKFADPWGIATDAIGNMYIADIENYRIRKMTPDGLVSTYAGNGQMGDDDGPNLSATFDGPYWLAVAPDGSVYVADQGDGDVRKIQNGQVTTVFSHNFVSGLAVDKNNQLYAITGVKIVKVAQDGSMTDFAGNNSGAYVDGQGTAASFGQLFGLTYAPDGNFYVADIGNSAIRKITSAGNVTTVAKNIPFLSYVEFINGNPVDNYPTMAVDSKGNIFFTNGYVVWKVKPDGTFGVFAGGTQGFQDGKGSEAKFSGTWGITIDKYDNLYVTDYKYSDDNDEGNEAIRKITPDGQVTTFAGGIKGYADGNVGETNTISQNIHITVNIPVKITGMPNVQIDPGDDCEGHLPDYTQKIIYSTPCAGKQLPITQIPPPGTLIDAGKSAGVNVTVDGGPGTSAVAGFTVTVNAPQDPEISRCRSY